MILQPLKAPVSPVDFTGVITLAGQLWVVLIILGAIGLLAVLHCAAASLRNAEYIHEIKIKVAGIRKDQLERLNALAEQAQHAAHIANSDVELVEPTAPDLNRRAA